MKASSVASTEESVTSRAAAENPALGEETEVHRSGVLPTNPDGSRNTATADGEPARMKAMRPVTSTVAEAFPTVAVCCPSEFPMSALIMMLWLDTAELPATCTQPAARASCIAREKRARAPSAAGELVGAEGDVGIVATRARVAIKTQARPPSVRWAATRRLPVSLRRLPLIR
ncbi:MAG TPA: hypothetical protein VN793_06565 [Acidimicrobiales bacterium]|nr:hypothetical protein [Acidimicrobiales bacterium]